MKYLVLVLVSSFSLSAFAYRIEDHQRVTEIAIKGLQDCRFLPKEWDYNLSNSIVKGNKSEDTDVIRKWSKYSHYFNPYKTLNMWRVDSSVTITETQQELLDLSKATGSSPWTNPKVGELLGRVVHHLQDATVPLHVIPVTHDLSDGFEKFESGKFEEELEVNLNICDDLRQATPAQLLPLLQQTAVETYDDLYNTAAVVAAGFEREKQWLGTFWIAGKDNEFGDYGPYGNNFGETSFTDNNGKEVKISLEEYKTFKNRRLNRAVFATQRAILWSLKNMGFVFSNQNTQQNNFNASYLEE